MSNVIEKIEKVKLLIIDIQSENSKILDILEKSIHKLEYHVIKLEIAVFGKIHDNDIVN